MQGLQPTHAKDRFHGRTVAISGGAGDFGMNCGIRMAKEGANVALIGRTEESLNAAKLEVGKTATGNAKCMIVVCDVTKPEDCEAALAAIEKEFTHIHYVFNNAGYQGDFAMV